MKKLGINYENVINISKECNLSIKETLKELKLQGYNTLDVLYNRFLEDKSLISTILVSGFEIASVFYVGNLKIANNYSTEIEIIDFCASNNVKDIMLLTKPLSCDDDSEKCLFNVKQNLRRIVKYSNQYGVRISIENFGDAFSFYNSPKKVLDVLKSVKDLYLVFDGGNFYKSNEDVLEGINLLKPYVSRVHLKDYDQNFKPTAIGYGNCFIDKTIIEFNESVTSFTVEYPFDDLTVSEIVKNSALYFLTREDI